MMRMILSLFSILGLHTVVMLCPTFRRAVPLLVFLVVSSYRGELQFLWAAAGEAHQQWWLVTVGILHLGFVGRARFWVKHRLPRPT